MQPGKAYSPEIVAQALELYREHGSSIRAAQELAAITGEDPGDRTIRQWAQNDAELFQHLSTERKHRWANRWYDVGNRLLDNVERGIDNIPPAASVVPAAIATDKFHKLVTEEHAKPTQGNQTFIIFEQPRPEPHTIDAIVRDVTDA